MRSASISSPRPEVQTEIEQEGSSPNNARRPAASTSGIAARWRAAHTWRPRRKSHSRSDPVSRPGPSRMKTRSSVARLPLAPGAKAASKAGLRRGVTEAKLSFEAGEHIGPMLARVVRKHGDAADAISAADGATWPAPARADADRFDERHLIASIRQARPRRKRRFLQERALHRDSRAELT